VFVCVCVCVCVCVYVCVCVCVCVCMCVCRKRVPRSLSRPDTGSADGGDLNIDFDDTSAVMAGIRDRAAGDLPRVMKLVQVSLCE